MHAAWHWTTLEKAHTANLIENMLNQQHEMCCTESPLVLDGTRLRATCSSGRWHWRVGTGWPLGSFPIQTIQWFYDSIANACCLWSTNRTIKMWKSLQNLLFTPYTSRTQSDLSKNFSLVRISRFQSSMDFKDLSWEYKLPEEWNAVKWYYWVICSLNLHSKLIYLWVVCISIEPYFLWNVTFLLEISQSLFKPNLAIFLIH